MNQKRHYRDSPWQVPIESWLLCCVSWMDARCVFWAQCRWGVHPGRRSGLNGLHRLGCVSDNDLTLKEAETSGRPMLRHRVELDGTLASLRFVHRVVCLVACDDHLSVLVKSWASSRSPVSPNSHSSLKAYSAMHMTSEQTQMKSVDFEFELIKWKLYNCRRSSNRRFERNNWFTE